MIDVQDKITPNSLASTGIFTSRARKRAQALVRVRQWIWLYFWLLIFEGALRKWVLPGAANVILLIRDPVVLMIYSAAFGANLLKWRPVLVLMAMLAFLMFLGGIVALPDGLVVVLFGGRTNFLHAPMALLIPAVFDAKEVHKVGRILLLLSVPMAILMTIQFVSPSSAWINSGADESFVQIATARGHIRAPGTFSYIMGPVGFYTLISVFLIHSYFFENVYSLRLRIYATLGTILAVLVSGSRTLVASVAVVVIFGVLATAFFNRQRFFRMFASIGILVGLGSLLTFIPVVQEGVAALGERFGDAKEFQEGFIMREVNSIFPSLGEWYTIPFWGYGLGRGTNVGTTLYTGRRNSLDRTNAFELGEEEIIRNFYESGLVLGFLFVAFRFALAGGLLLMSIKQGQKGNVLPFLFCGMCVLNVINAQLGQATLLGFTVLGSGLCLASMQGSPALRKSPDEEAT